MEFVIVYKTDNVVYSIRVKNCETAKAALRVFRAEYMDECTIISCCSLPVDWLDANDYDME